MTAIVTALHKLYMYCTYTIEMQRYIDILSYHDTLGSDTVLIDTHLGRIYVCIEYRDILMYCHKNVYFYIQLML